MLFFGEILDKIAQGGQSLRDSITELAVYMVLIGKPCRANHAAEGSVGFFVLTPA
jgi:hypothetical protein